MRGGELKQVLTETSKTLTKTAAYARKMEERASAAEAQLEKEASVMRLVDQLEAASRFPDTMSTKDKVAYVQRLMENSDQSLVKQASMLLDPGVFGQRGPDNGGVPSQQNMLDYLTS